MKLTICIWLLAFSLALFSCKKVSEDRACMMPIGIFVNENILTSCSSGNLTFCDPHFVELDFKYDSTVVLNNGREKYAVPLQFTSMPCQYQIRVAGSTEWWLHYADNGQLYVSKAEVAAVDTSCSFARRSDENTSPLSFDHLFNDCVIAGEYTIVRDGKTQPGYVTVLPNGQLNGMKPYLGYSICYTSDCLTKAWLTLDLIDGKGEKQSFYVKKSDGKSSFKFFPAPEGTADVPEDLEHKPLLFELLQR